MESGRMEMKHQAECASISNATNAILAVIASDRGLPFRSLLHVGLL